MKPPLLLLKAIMAIPKFSGGFMKMKILIVGNLGGYVREMLLQGFNRIGARIEARERDGYLQDYPKIAVDQITEYAPDLVILCSWRDNGKKTLAAIKSQPGQPRIWILSNSVLERIEGEVKDAGGADRIIQKERVTDDDGPNMVSIFTKMIMVELGEMKPEDLFLDLCRPVSKLSENLEKITSRWQELNIARTKAGESGSRTCESPTSPIDNIICYLEAANEKLRDVCRTGGIYSPCKSAVYDGIKWS